jgi:hypothetical protein
MTTIRPDLDITIRPETPIYIDPLEISDVETIPDGGNNLLRNRRILLTIIGSCVLVVTGGVITVGVIAARHII